MRELLWDLIGEEVADQQGLPPGFRFHPTDEELVTFYLASKVFHGGFCGVDIVEVDLNRCEPWELPDVAKMGEREWYFFSLRDRKYPTGLRTNRATGAGYWKATGKDREVRGSATGALVGMKKTLVFYKGRAPRGEKTKWVLHEYRLVDAEFSSRARHISKEEWVICRILHKTAGAADKKSQCYYPNPTILIDDPSSSSFNSCGEINYSIQTFLDNPNYIHGLQPPSINFQHEMGHSIFPLPPLPSAAAAILQPQLNETGQYCSPHQENSLHSQPSLQEDSASMSAWFERCLQSPFQLYDMGLTSFGIQRDTLLENRNLNIYN